MFAMFKNVADGLELRETPSKLCRTFLNIAKHDKIMTKNQFTRISTQTHRNRKFCQFNDDQYCTYVQDRKWISLCFVPSVTRKMGVRPGGLLKYYITAKMTSYAEIASFCQISLHIITNDNFLKRICVT